MVLEEYHLRLLAVGCLVGLYPVIDFLEKRVARVSIFNVKGFREEFLAGSLGVHRAHQAVHKGRVEVHHEGEAHAVVQGCLHGRPPVLCQAGDCEIVLDLFLADHRVITVGLFAHPVQKGSVKDGESVLSYGCEGVAAGLHPKFVLVFVGGVATSGYHESGVLSELPGNRDKVFNLFHIRVLVMCSVCRTGIFLNA